MKVCNLDIELSKSECLLRLVYIISIRCGWMDFVCYMFLEKTTENSEDDDELLFLLQSLSQRINQIENRKASIIFIIDNNIPNSCEKKCSWTNDNAIFVGNSKCANERVEEMVTLSTNSIFINLCSLFIPSVTFTLKCFSLFLGPISSIPHQLNIIDTFTLHQVKTTLCSSNICSDLIAIVRDALICSKDILLTSFAGILRDICPIQHFSNLKYGKLLVSSTTTPTSNSSNHNANSPSYQATSTSSFPIIPTNIIVWTEPIPSSNMEYLLSIIRLSKYSPVIYLEVENELRNTVIFDIY